MDPRMHGSAGKSDQRQHPDMDVEDEGEDIDEEE